MMDDLNESYVTAPAPQFTRRDAVAVPEDAHATSASDTVAVPQAQFAASSRPAAEGLAQLARETAHQCTVRIGLFNTIAANAEAIILAALRAVAGSIRTSTAAITAQIKTTCRNCGERPEVGLGVCADCWQQLRTVQETCAWPGCRQPAMCGSGNFGGELVCSDHFKITNATAVERLDRVVYNELLEWLAHGRDCPVASQDSWGEPTISACTCGMMKAAGEAATAVLRAVAEGRR